MARSRTPGAWAQFCVCLLRFLLKRLRTRRRFAAQLLMAEGYQTTRAGIGAFLALTELGFVFALDALVLREPTSWLAAAGTAVVFAGATGVATG